MAQNLAETLIIHPEAVKIDPAYGLLSRLIPEQVRVSDKVSVLCIMRAKKAPDRPGVLLVQKELHHRDVLFTCVSANLCQIA